MYHHSLFIGIDVSKLKHDIAVMNEYKKLVLKPFVIQDDLKGYHFLLSNLNTLAEKYNTKQYYIGMEATADYWKNIYYFLKKQSKSYSVTVINPVRTKAFAKTELRRAKTDPVNAKDIALFMAEKQPHATIDKPQLFDNIKDVDRQIYTITKQQTMMINKLRLELTKVAPEIEKAINKVQGKQILSLLERYPTAHDIDNASIDELSKIRYGMKQWRLPISFIQKMKLLAKNSIAYKTGIGAGSVVQSLVRSIQKNQQEVEYLKQQALKLYENVKEHESLLVSIPGITHNTAVALEACIGDVNRFSNSRKFVAYFGMNPTVNKSGKSRRKSRLQKKGNPIVRHKLFMATLCLIRDKESFIYPYYKHMLNMGKPKLVAICAAMRKLLTIIYAMLINQESFNAQKN
jgi:transposase